MADTKVSALTNVDPLAAADEFYVVDATGTTSAAVLASVVATFVLSQTASSVDITGGSISGITDLAVADGGTGASTAADARTNLDVDQSGTDNSTDVTLAGTPDYITIAGQTITRNQIDLAADVTGDLPVADGGTGASTAADARTNLDVYSTGEVDSEIDTDVATHAALTATHGVSGDVVGTTDTQTLTNKTIADNSNDVNADDVWLPVRNASGATLTKGTPVYASGYNVGQELVEVEAADATSGATMPCLGLVSADISNNADGNVIVVGVLDDIDTSAYSVGDIVYVSETAGELTSTVPTGSALVQKVAEVVRSNASNGRLTVNLQQANETGFIATLLDDGDAATARATLGAEETLSGATLTGATVATGDKVLVQDVDDSDNLKTVTAQSIADLGGGSSSSPVLLSRVSHSPGAGNDYNTTSSTLTAVDTTNLRLPDFDVPADGRVRVRIETVLRTSSTTIFVGLGILDGASEVDKKPTGITGNTWVNTVATFPLTGLTGGATETWDLAFYCESAAAEAIILGETTTLVEVWTDPAP